MADGFDTHELDDFEKDLLRLANDNLPKESKKFLKKSATKLSKVQKKDITSLNIGQQGFVMKDIIARSKSGKVYKYNGNLSCRAYNGHPLAHLIDQGYILKGGRHHDGVESFIKGYKFIDKAQREFEPTHYDDIQKFIDDMLNNHGL
ncbi:HK97 gp10 family phage protein [Clostridium sp. FP1]|uniref:HK97 gp10 family phage protein n=1 Tax=Clostridium sp. FP1 TaxID=2724076 RepID=UPI0013E97C0B|nr:HK97 gp10 family phage protein [Clostridium sp. FP1]MBZ9633188.1 HK97 gp10 family phage protein [Clostridium sp. FP1]